MVYINRTKISKFLSYILRIRILKNLIQFINSLQLIKSQRTFDYKNYTWWHMVEMYNRFFNIIISIHLHKLPIIRSSKYITFPCLYKFLFLSLCIFYIIVQNIKNFLQIINDPRTLNP